jgi:Flp pilus assembly protein TadD
MPLLASDDFGAQQRDDSGELKVHDHLFPSANTAIPVLVGLENAAEVVEAHRKFNEGVMRVDIFGVKQDAAIDGELTAPLRPNVPALEPGKSYLIEAVIRTVKMGHTFTQGTTDSNEVWMEVSARSGDRLIGRSGHLGQDGEVDAWSHFVNQFVLDREGYRIDRRNAEAIFAPLYNNQIPPGAADVVHYRLDVPPDITEPIEVEIKLNYRKFDTRYMKLVYGEDFVNDLPILDLAQDSVTFPVRTSGQAVANADSPIPEWQRWNDYGIGLLRKQGQGELRQAEQAFQKVYELGRSDGPLNLARVYLREGRVARDAPEALRTAAAFDPPAPQWTVLWFSGLVNQQNGRFDEAIRDFEQILEGGFEQAVGRQFDFSRDYRLLNELAQTYYERARQERGESRRAEREAYLQRALAHLERVLELEPEDLTAHWNMNLIYADLGDTARAAEHAALHARYKPDDNARDSAIAEARRRYPAANRAAEAVVIYELNREIDGAQSTAAEVASNE